MSDKVIDQSGWHFTMIHNVIVETDQLNIYQKMFYICLKRFANTHTDIAFPGVKRLAVMSGMSERKSREVISELENLNLISVERRINNTSIYTLLPIPSDIKGHAHDAPHAHDAGQVVQEVQGGGAGGADKREKQELKKDEREKEYNVADAPALPYKDIIDYLNERSGKQYRSSGKKTQGLIKARFKEGFTLTDFQKVIDHKCGQWKGGKMDQYLRPETLFGPKFEGYLNERGADKGGTHQQYANSHPAEHFPF